MPESTPFHARHPVIWYFLVAAALLLLLFGAARLLEPPAVRAQEGAPPPVATPDAQNGLALYRDRCASCHGPLGEGDGEMAAQLPRPPAALASEAFIEQAVPATMFDVITNGIVEAGMPPFGPGNSDPLDEQQRWDLVAAIYSLGASEALLQEGQALYEASCQECHAADGSGAEGVSDLREQSGWLGRSDAQVRQAIAEAPEHEALSLTDDELRAVTAFARAFSYDYENPLAAFEPIAAATISGVVTNESTGQPLQEDTPAVLSAFTADFQPSLTMTTTLDSTGQYAFDLTMTPPDLVYVVTVQHEGISYGSDFGRLERDDPALTLDIPVYDRTTDAATVSIDQLHIIVLFSDGLIQVSELYQFSQNAQAVFVGESGEPASGTVRVAVPPDAATPSFDRSFGGMESFFPAENVIPVDGGWADTVPLRPGSSSLSLLVRYTLPYEAAATIDHVVHYPVNSIDLVLPDAGVVVGEGDWHQGQTQVMGEAGAFLTYTQSDLPAGAAIRFDLQGSPRLASSTANVPQRNPANELLVGGGVLLLVIAAGAFTISRWRQEQEDEEEEADAPVHEATRQDVAPPRDEMAQRRAELLQRMAALDDAFEAGELAEAEYQAQRAALKEALLAIWHG